MSLKSTYYTLSRSLNEKTVGIFPQCDGMSAGYNMESPDSVYAFAHQKGRKCPFVPNLKSYKLHNKAKLTDFLSGCPGPGDHIVISRKFYDIINRHSIGPHQVFQTSIEHKKVVYDDYVTLHFIYDLSNQIRFKDSIFVYAGKEIKGINSFDAYEKYLAEHDELGISKAKSTHVDKDKFGNLDLFVIGLYNQQKYVSAKLYSDVIENKITGIELKPAEDLVMH